MYLASSTIVLTIVLHIQIVVSQKQVYSNTTIMENSSTRNQTMILIRNLEVGLEISSRKVESNSVKRNQRESPSTIYEVSREDHNHKECPTWMHYKNKTNQCVCGASYHDVVKCDVSLNETYILNCYQMTYDRGKNIVIAGPSIYGCMKYHDEHRISSTYNPVPANRSQINDVMCGQFNRDGRLCGACMDGHSPLVYSYQLYCKKCSDEESKYNWAKFIAMAFVPLTGFYIIVVLFHINANSPEMHDFVLFAQFISAPAHCRLLSESKYTSDSTLVPALAKLISTLYGIWNLDYFRSLYPDNCLRISTLQALSLDCLIALYPMLLIILTNVLIKLYSKEYRVMMWIWKLIRWCIIKVNNTEDNKTSVINVFATFLILSYTKIMSVNFDLLAYTVTIDSSGKSIGRYLYYDASYIYFGKDHLPYGVIAIFLFVVMNFLPFIILLFYPMKWFQKCLNHLRLSKLALHIFVDSFSGHFKDGTEPGTRDCRYFAAFFLFIRIIIYAVYQASLTEICYGLFSLISTCITILLIIVQPYKRLYHNCNIATAIMFGILTMLILSAQNFQMAEMRANQYKYLFVTVGVLSVALPQLYIIGIALRSIHNTY